MNDTIIIIKDDVASNESATSIINNICKPLVSATDDINLKLIVVAINDNIEDSLYSEYASSLPNKIVFKTITTQSKLDFVDFHNYVVEHIAITGYNKVNLHIISGALSINDTSSEVKQGCKTLVGSFINDLLDMTILLKRPVWFSTASDAANFSFNHYFTIADILNIDGKIKHFKAPECMMWSGNSNLDWIYVNTTMTCPISLRFETCYDYDFLAIKDMIAKSTTTPGYFVNLFPTIPREVGTFFRVPAFNRDNQQYDLTNDKYQKNLTLFNNNNNLASAQPKTVNDIISYMQAVLPKNK